MALPIHPSGRCYKCGEPLGTSARCVRCDQGWTYGGGITPPERQTDPCSGCAGLERRVRELEEVIEELQADLYRLRKNTSGRG